MFNTTYLQGVALLCDGLDTDVSRKVAELIRSDRHLELLQLEIDFHGYDRNDLDRFRNDYLAVELLSKYKGLTTGIDTRSVALVGFAAAEEACRTTNDRLTTFSSPEWARWMSVISLAQRKIEGCIGVRPKIAKLLNRFKWGQGATYSVKGTDVRLDYKLREKQISVTPEALPYLRAAMATDYAWLRARGVVADGPVSLLSRTDFQLVRGSRGITVPKNAKTDRFIAAEPSGNVFLQLGVGKCLRQCLHRVGVNLDDQRQNQDLARVALDHGLATIDLKAASDTIAWELVWLLLPLQWAELLTALRSSEMLIDDTWHQLAKFSSMGNGFTFELESLIFWALTESLTQHRCSAGVVSVYGDDIICPSEVAPELIELFSFVGFTTNARKSHYSGLFRESCGKHFFGGKDVTPVYQKDTPEADDRSTLYGCRNRLMYHALDRCALGKTGVALADRAFRRTIKLLDSEIERQVDDIDYCPIITRLHWNTYITANEIKFEETVKFQTDPIYDFALAVDARRLPVWSGGYRGNVYRYRGWSNAWVYKGLRWKATKFRGKSDALLAISLRYGASVVFDDHVTRRDVGTHAVARHVFPEPGNLTWI